jgi:hypothetical protein
LTAFCKNVVRAEQIKVRCCQIFPQKQSKILATKGVANFSHKEGSRHNEKNAFPYQISKQHHT